MTEQPEENPTHQLFEEIARIHKETGKTVSLQQFEEIVGRITASHEPRLTLTLTVKETRALVKAIEHRLDEFEFDGATLEDEEEIALLKTINQKIADLTDKG